MKALTHPAPGNHEYGTPGATGYYGYWGAQAGDPTKGYYSYDLGTWHVIVLNSQCSAVACGIGSARSSGSVPIWPRNQHLHPGVLAPPALQLRNLARDNAAYQPFWQALYDFGADVVMNGHEHNYERFALQSPTGAADPNGVREFVAGTGGKSHYGFGTPIANSMVRDSSTFGVLKLTLHPTSYDWQFVPEAGGTFTDSGTANCVTSVPPPTGDFSLSSSPAKRTVGAGRQHDLLGDHHCERGLWRPGRPEHQRSPGRYDRFVQPGPGDLRFDPDRDDQPVDTDGQPHADHHRIERQPEPHHLGDAAGQEELGDRPARPDRACVPWDWGKGLDGAGGGWADRPPLAVSPTPSRSSDGAPTRFPSVDELVLPGPARGDPWWLVRLLGVHGRPGRVR